MRPATATATKIIHHQNRNFIKQKSNLRYQPKLRNPIAQPKIHKKEEADPFLILLQSAFSFFSGGTKIKFRVSKPKPAAKRISKQTVKFLPKPKKLLAKMPIKKIAVKTSRPPPASFNDSNKQSKQVFPHSDGFPLKVNKATSPQDVSHPKSHNEGVKHLVVELHKTVHNILKQQNTTKHTKAGAMPPLNSQEPIINIHQVNHENHQPLPSNPADFPTTSEPTRFEPFVPNFLQLEDGRKVMRKRPGESSFFREGEERISQTHPGIDKARPELRSRDFPPDPAANIDDCQELVSGCYEKLLDRKIVQLQSEMARLEEQYWGDKV